MAQLGFAAGAITGPAAVAATVAVPIPLLGAALSDRLGRVPMLVVCAVFGGLGLLILSAAVFIWHIWIAMSLLAIMMATTGAVAPALITDLIPEVDRDRALAFVNASTWFEAVAGFAAFGSTASTFGVSAAIAVVVVLPLVAVGMLAVVDRRNLRGRTAFEHNALP